MKKPARILIVGLGLIGGSLAACCRKKFPGSRIIGVTRNRAALNFAKRKGWIHEGYRDVESVFKNIGATHASPPLVALCTPVDTLKNFLLRLDRIAPKGTVVTDAGSVKEFICRWAKNRRWRNLVYGGAHPMAGSHRQGIQNADPGLFRGSLTFVCPGPRRVLDFWKKISSKVVVISPREHDRVTAEISHLPHFLAAALVQNVSKSAWPFASTGFRDTTRIAQGPPDIWAPIFLGNRKALGRALAGFETRLRRLKKILQKGNPELLRRTLLTAQMRRTRMS